MLLVDLIIFLKISDLINIYKYLKGGGRHTYAARLLSVVCSNRTGSNGLKLEHTKFCTNMRKNFFMLTVTEHRIMLPREVAESPSKDILKTLKTHLDVYLCNLL